MNLRELGERTNERASGGKRKKAGGGRVGERERVAARGRVGPGYARRVCRARVT